MLKWLISKFMATCPKHGCIITETITDDVFCGVCRDAENKQRIKDLEEELEHYRKYAGSQMLMSDFQTADQMREALRAEQFLASTLRVALIQMLTNQRWSLEEATAHVNAEFTTEKARRILDQNENQADNPTV